MRVGNPLNNFRSIKVFTHDERRFSLRTSRRWTARGIQPIGFTPSARSGPDGVPSGSVLHALLTWLNAQYFPHHRSARLAVHSQAWGAMPGHDTLGAGWLLPVTGVAETIHGGVICNGRVYRSPWFRSLPGRILQRREFPLFYPKVSPDDPEPGIFVEVSDAGTQHVSYLKPV